MRGNPQECVITVTRFISSCWILTCDLNVTLVSLWFNCSLYVPLVLCPPALEAERVFAFVSFLMAVSTGVLCLVFAFCWTSRTVRSYSNTRSLLMAGQALYPTTLLLLTMASTGNCSEYENYCRIRFPWVDFTHFSFESTGFFFLLSWSLFTYQHLEEISQDFSSLGSSYWLGAGGWVLLLVVEMIVFIAERSVVPDIIPDLEKAVESWRISSQLKAAKHTFSEGYYPGERKSKMAPKRPVPWMECRNKDMTGKREYECVSCTFTHTDSMGNWLFWLNLWMMKVSGTECSSSFHGWLWSPFTLLSVLTV